MVDNWLVPDLLWCMAVATEDKLDRVFSALSDPSRRQILRDLAGGDLQVKEISQTFSFSKAATSKHLSVLEDAGLIKKSRQGREVLCSINPRTLQTVEEWLDRYRRFWDERLDALEAFVTTKPKT